MDMLRLSSGKRYSSKLSLPSQGTVRQRFTDLKGHSETEITLWGEKVLFKSINPIGYTAYPYFLV